MSRPKPVDWPHGKAFAFSVFDDTDGATIENIAPVYALLEELGMRTTKSVWPIRLPGVPHIGGSTLDDPDYAAWTVGLQHRGFEIGYHGASNITARRQDVERALNRFRSVYGSFPSTMANHADCAEGMYWGSSRLSGLQRGAYDALTRFRRRGVYRGHVEGDPLFWGDLCRESIRYVRNFTFPTIDTLAACPMMPYHDHDRPYVNAWFASSEGRDVEAFVRCLSDDNQDQLERGGGACIMYTHFSAGFVREGVLDPRFEAQIRRLTARNGWFVPVGTLLDFLASRRESSEIGRAERASLERRWLQAKLRIGPS
jgi:hypothetical protein